MVLVLDGRRYAASLRALLRESEGMCELAEASAKGPCTRATCKRRVDELRELKLSTQAGAPTSRKERRMEASLHAQLTMSMVKIKDLELELRDCNQRRASDRAAVERDKEAAISSSLQPLALELEVAQSKLEILSRERDALLERARHRSSSLEEHTKKGAEAIATIKKLGSELDAANKELDTLRSEQPKLLARSSELASLRRSLAAKARHARDLTVARAPKKVLTTPMAPAQDTPCDTPPTAAAAESKADRKRRLNNECRVRNKNIEYICETVGEDCDPDMLAQALECLDLIDKLMETVPFWNRRMAQGRALVAEMNGVWDAKLAARVKNDYLLSDRDMDGLRVDLAMVVVANKPYPRPLLTNAADPSDKPVYFPEPITKRCGGWYEVVQEMSTRFGLSINPDHPDAAERDWDDAVQKLVTRDGNILESPGTFGVDRPLNLVVGFDGADDFCHVALRLIDYNDNVAKESEMKGVGLCVAKGDDHNANLALQFKRLGPAINLAIDEGGSVNLHGRRVPYIVNTGLDYSASRSINALRSNAAPHSAALDPHLVIEVKEGASYQLIKKTLEQKLPWRDYDVKKPLNHIAPGGKFPWNCSRCDYAVANQEEEDANIQAHIKLCAVKTLKGKRDTAARTAKHCDCHDQTMEFQERILRVHPLRNIIDYLHALDINCPQRIFAFSFHDHVIFAEDPQIANSLAAYYTFINCPFDPAGEKAWWHGSVWHYDFVLGRDPRRALGLTSMC